MQRFKKYLKNTNDWEKFNGIENHLSIYRYKKYPNFQIIINLDQEITKDFREEWMKKYPDDNHNFSVYVKLEANTMLLKKELFVFLDGCRYFVPVPKISITEKKDRQFYYDEQQIQLYKIIGKHPSDKNNIDIFIKECKKNITVSNS